MMIDDQDRCEWENVSSGTSSPRHFWTKGSKMVVVIVLAVLSMQASILDAGPKPG